MIGEYNLIEAEEIQIQKSQITKFFRQKSQLSSILQKQREKESAYEKSDILLNQISEISVTKKKPLKIKHYFQNGQTIFNNDLLLINLQQIDEQKLLDSIQKLQLNSSETSTESTLNSSGYLQQLCQKSNISLSRKSFMMHQK
eukprot:TRINITY_DN6458_c0_g1_i3.p1 TRINITY_DN6458_c0_g1~~TRINITY_DN6458_c0_g1_i3.p1  ORF type:complete len:143 (+),score=16.05 TRINITY_DN6458_c0_g1_i3:103-531(+)